MAKTLIEGREYFDGEPVEIYEAKFGGSFQMLEETAAPLATDDLVTFIVTARVNSPKFTFVAKTGDLKRSNTMKVEEAFVIDKHEAKWLLDNMGEDVEGVNAGLVETGEQQDTEPELFRGDWDVR